jgi:hypothetical protein
MKTVLLMTTLAGGTAEHIWQENAIVRRIQFTAAVRVATRGDIFGVLRRGPASSAAPTNGATNIVAATVVSGSGAGNQSLDIACYEQVSIGERWHINCDVLSGTLEALYTYCVLFYEPRS